jgi:hypothetical protein
VMKSVPYQLIIATMVVFGGQSSGQTTASGLIYSNTTWNKAGSPYIVTGNMDVNQGVTLTIEAGVQVRFAGSYYLYIDGALTAAGTPFDSILFTSNKPSPSVGDWVGVKFRINSLNNPNTIQYCHFSYANYAIAVDGSSPDISHSLIEQNQTGIYIYYNYGYPVVTDNIITHNVISGIYGYNYGTIFGPGGGLDIVGNKITYNGNGIDMPVTATKIDSNNISGNTNGIYLNSGAHNTIPEVNNNTISNNFSDGLYLYDYPITISSFQGNTITDNKGSGIFCFNLDATIQNCIISGNGTGIWNAANSDPPSPSLHQNCIYGNQMNISQSATSNMDATGNWWGTTDSAAIASLIHDFYDDFNLGQVAVKPVLTTYAPKCLTTKGITAFVPHESRIPIIRLYPNPSNGSFAVSTSSTVSTLTVSDANGRIVLASSGLNRGSARFVDISRFSKGIYFVRAYDGERCQVLKTIVQ